MLIFTTIQSMLIMSWYKKCPHITQACNRVSWYIFGAPLCLPPWQGALTPVLPGVELYCDWEKLQQTCLSAFAANRATCQAMHQYTVLKISTQMLNSSTWTWQLVPIFKCLWRHHNKNFQFPFRAKCMIETIISGINPYTTLKFTKSLLISKLLNI
jgi:hypothetical protein